MNSILTTAERNSVLKSMAHLIAMEQEAVIKANQLDLETYSGLDLAMEDRLKVDGSKIAGMILSLEQLAVQDDPIGKERFHFTHDNGMNVINKTAPFGTVLIIYESRPDVTVEAAGIAFKSGNKILLKGGKESLNSNLKIMELWQMALNENGISGDWVTYLNYNRSETQQFLEKPTQKIDLIVPRGGEKLIAFVKEHATCPVIVSGRGNNFVYVHSDADLTMARDIIINAKLDKISACNALDKVLINSQLDNKKDFLKLLIGKLMEGGVTVWAEEGLYPHEAIQTIENKAIWYEEFLDYKIAIGQVNSEMEAIEKINKYCGGHSASIITTSEEIATVFMENVDTAAVYHNASTRFTDGGQFGLGGELAISTDKLHQRGPIGLEHLVTNKWYIYGNGQIR